MQRMILWLATGFGLGYSPVASGTVGSLWGILLAWFLIRFPLPVQIAAATALAVAAIPICDQAENVLGEKDDGRIVADEYLTFPICMLGLPFVEHPWLLLAGFCTMRFFDIIKPSPAREMQHLRGGLGIVLDDVVAALYSLLLNHGVWWLVKQHTQGGVS